MKTSIALLAILAAGSVGFARRGDTEPPLRVVDGLFDLSNSKTLGLGAVPGRHVDLYRAEEADRYRFSHHPGLAVFRGQLYASWSSGFFHEDRPGQRVVYSRSTDGINWSAPRVLVEPQGARDRCIAAGFHVANETLVAYYTRCRDYPVHNLMHPDNALLARTSQDGLHWSAARRVTSGFFIEAPRRLSSERLLLGGEWVGQRNGVRHSFFAPVLALFAHIDSRPIPCPARLMRIDQALPLHLLPRSGRDVPERSCGQMLFLFSLKALPAKRWRLDHRLA